MEIPFKYLEWDKEKLGIDCGLIDLRKFKKDFDAISIHNLINTHKEIEYFTKKHKFEMNLLANNNLLMPEYKIDLFNKNKKIIKKVYNIEDLEKNKKNYFRPMFKKNKFNNNYRKKSFKRKNNFRPNREKKYFDNNKKLANQ